MPAFITIPDMKQPFLMIYALVGVLLLSGNSCAAQKRWVGAGGNWDDAVNWQPTAVPDSNDQVILDNSFQPNAYTVKLPDHAVTVNTLVIAPAGGRQIELYLPATNLGSPAFIARSTGDAIVIGSGGILCNASGINSGQSLQINGGLRIENGGLYIHQTRSGHAADVVAKLSTAAGTETGSFEFDVPGGSYPVSLSNRIYGKLVFSAQASGGTQTYNASGTNPLLVRGDLVINDGVTINLDFTKDFTVMGNYLQNGGVFNIASQPSTNRVNLQGDVNQAAGSIITETSTGLPLIEFNGKAQQQVSLAGSLLNQLVLRVNNPAGVFLLHNLTIPYLLQMQQGNLFTSPASLLIIPGTGQVTGASAQSFVEGPVKKKGDEAFEFPVGRQRDYAPVAVSAGSSASDEFVATYYHGNPQAVYGTALEYPPIHHLSTLEYWSIEQTGGSSSRKITLPVGTYSHATAVDKLLVSRWNAGGSSWVSEGNAAWSGIATGKITSNPVTSYGAFTLASTVEDQNPLPLRGVNNDRIFYSREKTFFDIKQVSCTGRNVVVTVFSRQRQRVQIVITASDGKTIYNARHEVTEGNNQVYCAIPFWSKRIYFIRVADNRGESRFRTIFSTACL